MSYREQKWPSVKIYVFYTIICCIFCNPVDIIVSRQYQGQYYSNQAGNNFDYLQGKTGQIIAFFYGSPNREAVNSAEFVLLDPKYEDERVIFIDLKEIIDVNIQTEIWQSTHTLTYAKIWKQRQGDIIKQDGVNTTITFTNLDPQDYEAVKISIQSKGTSFSFTAQLTFYDQIISTMAYSLYVAGVTAIQIFCAFKLLKIMDAPNFVFCGKISLLTLSLCNIQDFSQTMAHVQYIMGSSSGYLFYILPSIAFIVLFIVFDMKMLFLVWKSHNIPFMDDPQLLRKKLTSFYIKFYLGLFLYLTLDYFFSFEEWMIILTNLILLPQLIHNVRLGQKPIFNPYYIFGYIGSRLLILFYQRTCPQNRFKLSQNITLCVILTAIYVTCVIIIALQYKLGSRFFVPKRFLPNYFEYKRKIKMDDQNKDEDCAICLQNLFQNMSPTEEQTNIREQIKNSLNEDDLLQQMTVMVTPCNHKFHVQCLTQWLQVKLQCPSCRTTLPPL